MDLAEETAAGMSELLYELREAMPQTQLVLMAPLPKGEYWPNRCTPGFRIFKDALQVLVHLPHCTHCLLAQTGSLRQGVIKADDYWRATYEIRHPIIHTGLRRVLRPCVLMLIQKLEDVQLLQTLGCCSCAPSSARHARAAGEHSALMHPVATCHEKVCTAFWCGSSELRTVCAGLLRGAS